MQKPSDEGFFVFITPVFPQRLHRVAMHIAARIQHRHRGHVARYPLRYRNG